jgi:hypothetical protein
MVEGQGFGKTNGSGYQGDPGKASPSSPFPQNNKVENGLGVGL